MSHHLLTNKINLACFESSDQVGNCISCFKVLFIKMIQLKVLKILSKNTIDQRKQFNVKS